MDDYGPDLVKRLAVYEALYDMSTDDFHDRYEARAFADVPADYHDWYHTAEFLKFLRDTGKTTV